MAVDRCTCLKVTFAELKSIADHSGADFEELSERTQCGMGCGMCVPYIRIMLATGITDLPILTADEYRKLLSHAKPS